ncbi:MAG: hypothetical protein ACOCQ4_01355, partial [bacterium]
MKKSLFFVFLIFLIAPVLAAEMTFNTEPSSPYQGDLVNLTGSYDSETALDIFLYDPSGSRINFWHPTTDSSGDYKVSHNFESNATTGVYNVTIKAHSGSVENNFNFTLSVKNCSVDSDCYYWDSDEYCEDGNVVRDNYTSTCSEDYVCTGGSTETVIRENCTSNQTCSDGSCVSTTTTTDEEQDERNDEGNDTESQVEDNTRTVSSESDDSLDEINETIEDKQNLSSYMENVF